MNGYQAAVFYQDLYTVGGDVIRWTLNHGIRPTAQAPATQNISVEIGAPKRDQNGNIVNAHGTGAPNYLYTEIESSSSAKYTYNGVTNGSTNSGYAKTDELKNLSLSKSSQADKWYDARGVYVIPEGQTVTRFAFISDVDNADGNMLDNITFSTLIGNLQAVLQDDGSVLVTGYWGDDDPTKALIIKTGDNVLEVNMDSVLNKHFSFVLSAEAIGENTSVEIYHQDYESAKRTVLIDRTQANIVELTKTDESVERYLTLTEAVEVVQNNEKITILRDIDEKVSVSKNITFLVDANGKQFDRNSIQAGPGYTLTKVTAGNVTTYTVESIITIAAGEGDPIPVEVKIVEETEKEEDQKGSVKENLSEGATEEQKNAAALIIGSLSDGKDGKNNSDIVDLTEVVKNMVNNLSVDQLKDIAAKQDETSGQEQSGSTAAELEALLEKASEEKEKGSTVDINMNLVTDVDVDVTDVQVDQTDKQIIKTFTLDIMPWYTMKVTTTITPDDGVATSESVTVAEKQKLEVTETTVVSFPAPNGFEYTNGMLVYVEHKKEDGTTYSYKADYDPTTGMISFTNPHGFSEFKMMTIEEESLGGAGFTATLNLADSIGIILYVNDPTKAPENYVVTATYKGVSTSTKLSSVTPKVENEKTKYGIVIADCAAAEMFETVHVVVTYDGYNIKEFDYSVYDYCNSKINDTDTDEKLKELCKAALDYGCYAKTFFEYEEMVPADSDYVPSDVSEVEASGTSASRSDLCAGIVSVSATLSLESRTKIIFYLTPDQGYSEESYTYSVSGGDLRDAAPVVTLGSDGRIRVEVLGIAAAKLGKVYTLTVKPTGGGDPMTVSYSPMTYAQTKQNSSTSGLPNLVKSLYVYYQKAAAFFTK